MCYIQIKIKSLQRSLTSLLFTLVLFSVNTTASAEFICLPEAVGVPAMSGPPNWWNSTVSTWPIWDREGDPRWQGAYANSPLDSGSATDHVEFQALTDSAGAEHFFSWNLNVAMPGSNNHVLYVGLNTGHTQEVVFRFTINGSVPSISSTEILTRPVTVPVSNFTTRTLPNPPWLTNRALIFGKQEANTWLLNMHIPPIQNADNSVVIDDTGLRLAQVYNMWYNVEIRDTESNLLTRYSVPSNIDFANNMNSSNWLAYQHGVIPSDNTCVKGISLDRADVGILTNPADIDSTITTEISLIRDNTFIAKPKNNTLNPIPGGSDQPKIHATFRIANWGTQTDWNSLDNPDDPPLWEAINPDPAPHVDGADIPADGGQAHITYVWDASNRRCEFIDCDPLPGEDHDTRTKRTHQCLLVELSGGGFEYTKKSVYRNMNFVDASEFNRLAEVSVRGAKDKVNDPRRDVYLYVKRNNMPELVSPKTDNPEIIFRDFGAYKLAKGKPKRRDVSGHRGSDDKPDKHQNYNPYRNTQNSYKLTKQVMPTYEVHAFRDTGKTEMINGVSYKVVKPQTSFGYFVRHEGSLFGWQDAITGDPGVITQISKDFYKISVPNDGATTIATSITAKEDNWALVFHAGAAIPTGAFKSIVKSGSHYDLGLEHMHSFTEAYRIMLGLDQFELKADSSDFDIESLSLQRLRYLNPGIQNVRPYVQVAAGLYDLSPGDTNLGVSAGAGLQYDINRRLSLDAVAAYHRTTGSGSVGFETVAVGFHYMF